MVNVSFKSLNTCPADLKFLNVPGCTKIGQWDIVELKKELVDKFRPLEIHEGITEVVTRRKVQW
eukprot:CAMPEP_0185914048 /NCGR_PEP_ID=MMETSP0924C-20121207/816_1 /TAXON_ID=321610 /ORGANISM="Perkinsus chesapeaki, Strain ATCC PRA-65" /LENGTH=63 /DNA_ID=CAMNT_0028636251 /DNA_START=320 /DNA_END=508 /DNA_ORIENTATION=-